MEGNVSFYRVNLVSRITGEGEGRSFEGRGGLVLIKSEQVWRGGGLGRGGQLNMCVETIHYFEGINVTVLEIMHQFIMYILG